MHILLEIYCVIHRLIPGIILFHNASIDGLFVSTAGYSIDLGVKSLHWVKRVNRGISVKVCLLCESCSDFLRCIEFHVWNLDILTLVLKSDWVFVVLARCWHVLGHILQKVSVKVSFSVLFETQVLFVGRSCSLLRQKISHNKPVFIRLCKLKLTFVDRGPLWILLKAHSFNNGLLEWLDVAIIGLNPHLMHVVDALVMYYVVFVVLVNWVIAQTVAHSLLVFENLQVFRDYGRAHDGQWRVRIWVLQSDWHLILESAHEDRALVWQSTPCYVCSVPRVDLCTLSTLRSPLTSQRITLVSSWRLVLPLFWRIGAFIVLLLNHLGGRLD